MVAHGLVEMIEKLVYIIKKSWFLVLGILVSFVFGVKFYHYYPFWQALLMHSSLQLFLTLRIEGKYWPFWVYNSSISTNFLSSLLRYIPLDILR